MRKMTTIYLSEHDRKRIERIQERLGTKNMAETIRMVMRTYLVLTEGPPKGDEDGRINTGD